ncbi:MAG: arylsulfatase [Saprospiraceae bacterium]
MFKKKVLYLVLSGILLSFLFFTRATTPALKPNILIIYADDLGYGDVSAYGKGTLQTLNIDKLAKGGLMFTNGYATSATCTPSRYALLTGVYPWRIKEAKVLPGDAPSLIDSTVITLPRMLQKTGYQTGIVGKWHLGLGYGALDWNKKIKGCPNNLGFDYSFIMAATNDRVPSVYVENGNVDGLQPEDPLFVNYNTNFAGEPTAITNPELMTTLRWQHGHNFSVHNGIPRIGYMKGGHAALWHDEDMADVFLNKAIHFIDHAVKEKSKKPFFLYYALHQPHVPRVPHPRFVGTSGMGPRGDAIKEADWCVGVIIHKLEMEGLDKNTLIIFTSDNGPVLNDGYYDDAVEKLGKHTPAGGLRGGKYSLYEGGTKVPFITYWKGKIKPGKSSAMMCQLDFMASFASLVHSACPKNDSQNFLPSLLGTSPKGRTQLVVEASGKLAYRENQYSMIPPYTGPAISEFTNIELGNSPEYQLYDLTTDPGQIHNLAKEQLNTLEKMKSGMNTIVQH